MRNLLPVVERELRVTARQKALYVHRGLLAFVAMGIGNFCSTLGHEVAHANGYDTAFFRVAEGDIAFICGKGHIHINKTAFFRGGIESVFTNLGDNVILDNFTMRVHLVTK